MGGARQSDPGTQRLRSSDSSVGITDDNNGWVDLSVSKLSSWFDVTTFGAVGNGTTDDTAAFNAAIAALNTHGGGVLYIPYTAGGYKLTASLTPLANAWIFGAGSVLLSNGGNPLWTFLGYCTMQGIVFNITGGHTQILCPDGSQKNVIDKVTFMNGTCAGSMVDFEDDDNILTNCVFDSTNSLQTITIGVVNNTLIQNNAFDLVNPGGYPIIVVKPGAEHFNITGNTFGGNFPTNSVVVQAGASDWYIIAHNNWNGIPISDGGTGTNKIVANNL